MDFGSVALDRIRWGIPVKKKVNCSYGSEKPRFQVPATIIKLTKCPKFEGAVELSLEEMAFPPAFEDFMEDVCASAYTALEDVVRDKTYYSPWKRVTMFDDALAFDANGDIVKDVGTKKGYHMASLLVQLDGVWFSELSWGLRVRVIQLKLHEENVRPMDPEPAVRIMVNGKPFLFVTDD